MPQPLWIPSTERIERANLSRFLKFVRAETGDPDIQDYACLYQFSITRPERFWTLLWDFCGIKASGSREPVLLDGDDMAGARWYPNVRLNFAQNLLRFDDERVALLFRDENGASERITYAQLRRRVAALAAALKAQGLTLGDHVAAVVPNVPDAVVAMLASTSLGAVWSAWAPDSDKDNVLAHLGKLRPKVLFSAVSIQRSGAQRGCLENIRGIVEKIDSIQRVLMLPCPAQRDQEAPDLEQPPPEQPKSLENVPKAVHLAAFTAPFTDADNPFVPTPFDHPLYLTFSADSAECIVHSAGGTLIQHLKEHVLHADVKREDKIFHATTCGEPTWHWLVSALAVGASVVLYDGSPDGPTGDTLWDLVDELGISIFGISARWIADSEKAGLRPRKSHKLLALKTVLASGTPLPPEGFDYIYREVKERLLLAPMLRAPHTLGHVALGTPLLPVRRGELQCRALGMKLEILDDAGQPVIDQTGPLACTAPFPAMPLGVWDDPDGARYRAICFARHPDIWCQGEPVRLTAHEGLVIHPDGQSAVVLSPASPPARGLPELAG